MIQERVDKELSPMLGATGMASLSPLLDESPVDQRLPGKWERLGKPGLGRRERYRWQIDDAASGRQTLYVKRYFATGWREQADRLLRQVFGHSRAWWEFRQSQLLAQKYVPAVRAVGMIEQMRGPVEIASAAVFAPVAGDAVDRVWERESAASGPMTRAPMRHEITRRLGRFVSSFHQTGYCHRDLYLCHVFIDVDPQVSRPPRFTLIDLARTHYPRLLRFRWLIKDLSQLDYSARQLGATRTDRLRFLQIYLGLQHHAPRVRYYARRIVRKSDAILARERRNGRA